jgi:orotidine-5'-phosphate decarboxylase
MEAKDRIIVALDLDNMADIAKHVSTLASQVGLFKVGLEAMHALGSPQLVERVHDLGGQIMYDAKLHDIPETMGKAMKAIATLGVKYVTIHASAGPKGIRAVVENAGKTRVIGVTVLTSHNEEECHSIFGDAPGKTVLRFAEWLAEHRAHAIVCSPLEAELLRQDPRYAGLEVITPGIRPLWARKNDQERVTTPKDAVRLGADRLVIGRPILQPPPEIGTPEEAARRIAEEIASAT